MNLVKVRGNNCQKEASGPFGMSRLEDVLSNINTLTRWYTQQVSIPDGFKGVAITIISYSKDNNCVRFGCFQAKGHFVTKLPMRNYVK